MPSVRKPGVMSRAPATRIIAPWASSLPGNTPAASVSGLYLAHPEARYFGVGRIGRDQVEDLALRKGWTLHEAERWLAPILGYEPGAADG